MNILLIDDEMTALNILERAVKETVPNGDIRCFGLSSKGIEELEKNNFKPDVAFIDIEMPGITGIELAKRLKDIVPKINIIFVTGYSDYTGDAMALHASGYLLKPATAEMVQKELEDLRYPILNEISRVKIHTFGNFEVFVDGNALRFPRSKSKEVFAYLVDRKGASSTISEISAVVFEDKPDDKALNNQTRQFIAGLMKTLKEVNAQDIIIKSRNSIAIDTSKVDCDYYRALEGDAVAFNMFTGEYMTNYSWAEFTLGALQEKNEDVRGIKKFF